MYNVSGQGIDECVMNVDYYYLLSWLVDFCFCLTFMYVFGCFFAVPFFLFFFLFQSTSDNNFELLQSRSDGRMVFILTWTTSLWDC